MPAGVRWWPGGSGRDLLNSIVTTLLVLDDDTVVLPGHGEKSTIGFERRFNKAFSVQDRAAFVERMLRDLPPPPPDAAAIRAANLGKPLVSR